MMWVKELIRDYRKNRKLLDECRVRLLTSEPSPEVENDLAQVESMIADMNYAIEWMRTGRRPHSRRGVDIHDAYKRSILMDMDLLPAAPPDQESQITAAQKRAAAAVLMKLSPRELECYLLHASNGLSLAQIAKELKLSKNSVRDYVDRAKLKVAQAI